jgi:predicted MFS family arabinose efflux permease
VTTQDLLEEDRPAIPSEAPTLWRNRDYVLLWSGQAVSEFGTQVSQIAFPLLILGITGLPAQAGIAAGLRILPYLILSLAAGALVDRWDRKRTMIFCDSARAVALGSIPLALWSGHLSIAQLYSVSLLEGTFNVFFGLALTACLPRVVTRQQIPAATAQNEAIFQIAKLLGPLLGGVLYGLGRLVPFLIDAVSYAASVVSLFFITTEFQERRTIAARRLRAEIAEGLIWLWNEPLVRAMGFLSSVAWIMLAAVNLVVIVLARQQHARPATIGLILAVGGVGGIVGSLVASPLQRRFSFGQIVIGSAWLWAFLWPMYAVAPNPVALGVTTAALNLVWPLYNVTQFSYRRALIPDHLQGRVNSVFRLISFSGMPVGLILSGALLQTIGPRSTVLVLALAPLAMAVGGTMNQHIRNARPLVEAHK